jgi:hypothetical protein
MSLDAIHNAVEMTTHPKLSKLLAVLVEHSGLTVSEAAALLDSPSFMLLRFADRLVRLGYATRSQSGDKRYFATIAGRNMEAVMRGLCP